ncbi:unnamed protein product, partial [Mesorhabditis belari]|uniref:Uncharacterized protein n=1 Tax=Mesorhabditis belari TaxID=2138241 RepID=A0AAF3FPU6_9BILA
MARKNVKGGTGLSGTERRKQEIWGRVSPIKRDTLIVLAGAQYGMCLCGKPGLISCPGPGNVVNGFAASQTCGNGKAWVTCEAAKEGECRNVNYGEFSNRDQSRHEMIKFSEMTISFGERKPHSCLDQKPKPTPAWIISISRRALQKT